VQWFFKMNHGDLNSEVSWDGNIDGSSSGLNTVFPGFNWAMIAKNILGTGDNGIRGVLSAFADEGLVRVLSSPSVMVLDNQTARIQVGDEVPIATSQQQSTSTDSNIVNSISYRDTGVVLEVTPRVNPGGLVTMEVRQEVSSARTSESSSLDSPTIATREVTSTVAVHSDQTVVLGGLIRDETENTRGGVPGAYKLPLVGWLFGQDTSSATRTELVVILTPSVIMGEKDILAVTEDFRSRLKGLEGRF
jgi:general secretion pathway protein D